MVGVFSTIGERRGAYKVLVGKWWGNLKKRDHLGDTSIGGRIILKRIYKKWSGGKD
jgi:hypothetical protein